MTQRHCCGVQEQLGPLHTQLGKQLVDEGDMAQAEAHFVAAGDWQAACAALREAGSWEDALRVARTHGGPAAEDEVSPHPPLLCCLLSGCGGG